MNLKHTTFQKFISFFIIIAIIAPSVLLYQPKKADAFAGWVADFFAPITGASTTNTAVQSTAQTALKIKDIAKEVVRQVLMTIAKRALQQMTKSTINWINSGFHGAPLFLKNPDSFFRDIAKFEIKRIIDSVGYDSLRFPFGKNFALNAIGSYKRQFEENAQYTLSKVINDPVLLSNFRTNFNVGGWNGFLINTQYPQNNYIGSQMMMTDELALRLRGTAKTAAEKVTDVLQQGMGFLSPKTCPSNPEYNNGANEFLRPSFNEAEYEKNHPYTDMTAAGSLAWTEARDKAKAEFVKKNSCPGGLVSTTPGSVVANQITNAMGSTFRQTELGAAMGNSISAILDTLLNKFLGDGLTALATKTNPKPVTDDWTYNGQTLGSPADSANSAWDAGPDEEIALDAFKKKLNGKTIVLDDEGMIIKEEIGYTVETTGGAYTPGDIDNTELELRLMFNEKEIPPPGSPAITISAEKTSINNGESTTITWSTEKASTCRGFVGANGWAGTKDTKGTFSTGNLTGTTIFYLTCNNTVKGTSADTKAVTINVQDETLGSTPRFTMSGGKVKFLLGDPWTIDIKNGKPNSPVQICTKSPSPNVGCTPASTLGLMPNTDGQGNWSGVGITSGKVNSSWLISAIVGGVNSNDIYLSVTDVSETIGLGITQILTKTWPEIRNLDICLPGPDMGWEDRLIKELERNSKKLQEKASDQDGEKAAAAQLVYNDLQYAVDLFKNWVREKMIKALPSSITYIDAVNGLDAIQQESKELTDKKRSKSEALARLMAIKLELDKFTAQPAPGSPEEKRLIDLKKKYNAISDIISNTNSIENTRNQLAIANDRLKNLTELLAQCREQKGEKPKGTGWTISPAPGGLSTLSGKTEKALFCDDPIKSGYLHGAFQKRPSGASPDSYKDLPLVNGLDVFRYRNKAVAIITFGFGGHRTVNIQIMCDLIYNTNITDYKKDIPGLTPPNVKDTTPPPDYPDERGALGTCTYTDNKIPPETTTEYEITESDCLKDGGTWVADPNQNSIPN